MLSVVRAGRVDRLQHLAQEAVVGARGVLGRELDVGARACARASPPSTACCSALLGRDLELVLQVDGGGGEEGVDHAGGARAASALPAGLDVASLACSGRAPRPWRPSPSSAIACDRLEVARRGDREAGLDHVDAEPLELARDAQLLGRVMLQPGDCSPSRSVVSKIVTRSLIVLLLPACPRPCAPRRRPSPPPRRGTASSCAAAPPPARASGCARPCACALNFGRPASFSAIQRFANCAALDLVEDPLHLLLRLARSRCAGPPCSRRTRRCR